LAIEAIKQDWTYLVPGRLFRSLCPPLTQPWLLGSLDLDAPTGNANQITAALGSLLLPIPVDLKTQFVAQYPSNFLLSGSPFGSAICHFQIT
jgi:hypothetical protein